MDLLTRRASRDSPCEMEKWRNDFAHFSCPSINGRNEVRPVCQKNPPINRLQIDFIPRREAFYRLSQRLEFKMRVLVVNVHIAMSRQLHANLL